MDWANPVWHSAASGADDRGLVGLLGRRRRAGGRVEAFQLRDPPQGLEVAGWEASGEGVWRQNLLALGGQTWKCVPALVLARRLRSALGWWGGGWKVERRICRLGTICLLSGGFGTSLFGCVDTWKKQAVSSKFLKKRGGNWVCKIAKRGLRDYDATYLLGTGKMLIFHSLVCCPTARQLEKWVRWRCRSESSPTGDTVTVGAARTSHSGRPHPGSKGCRVRSWHCIASR